METSDAIAHDPILAARERYGVALNGYSGGFLYKLSKKVV